MSATRPAIVFSMGIIARSALPVSTALKASSKVGQGNASMSGYMLRQAVSELAPGSPWKAILLVFGGMVWSWGSYVSGKASCGRDRDHRAYRRRAAENERSRRRCACRLPARATAPAARAAQARRAVAQRTALGQRAGRRRARY